MHLYVHVPFCARRCSYCDFAIAVRRSVPSDRFADAVLTEWADWQDHPVWRDRPPIQTIYFGGGTPSHLTADALERILDRIRADRAVSSDAEITLEANPEDVTPTLAACWRRAGVNRVSLGVQSFDPAVLTWMHRTHTAEQVPVAVHVLRDAGFGNLSLDLIFALPASLGRNWKADLERALALEPDHLSVYGLTLEPHTPFAHWIERGECRPPADERYAQEFLEAHSRLSPAGFEHYEVSNYARPGMASRHNSAYWTRAPYLGLGPSAHSAMGDERRWNLREWSAFERALAGRDSPIEGREVVSPEGRRLEELYLGLRTRSGVAQEQVPSRMAALWQEQGWAHLEAGNLRLTPEGWLRVDSLVLAVRNRAELSPALR